MDNAVLAMYRDMHRNPKRFRGKSLLFHTDAIGAAIEHHQARSLLDYGSGKGYQYTTARVHEAWGVPLPTCFDPGYPPFSSRPTGRFHGVICTDVLEHVPPHDIDHVVADLFLYAERFVFAAISTRRARKTLPDGRNCHLTIRPLAWWREKFRTMQRRNAVDVIITEGK